MKTTTPVLSIPALAMALLLAQPTFADDADQLSEEEAQDYAQELLKPEEERDGLRHIRDDEQKDHGYEDDDSEVREDDDRDADQPN